MREISQRNDKGTTSCVYVPANFANTFTARFHGNEK